MWQKYVLLCRRNAKIEILDEWCIWRTGQNTGVQDDFSLLNYFLVNGVLSAVKLCNFPKIIKNAQ